MSWGVAAVATGVRCRRIALERVWGTTWTSIVVDGDVHGRSARRNITYETMKAAFAYRTSMHIMCIGTRETLLADLA